MSIDVFLSRRLRHHRTLREVTCILAISSDPSAHVISYHLPSFLSRNPAGFAGVRYAFEFGITYAIDWIIFLNVLLLNAIFLYRPMAHVNASNLLCLCSNFLRTFPQWLYKLLGFLMLDKIVSGVLIELPVHVVARILYVWLV